MKMKAVQNYKNGDNCAQCIIRFIASEYQITLSEQIMPMLQGMSNGLGVGCMCCLLDAGIMAFGLLFDENTTKRLRIKLLYAFKSRYGDMNCHSIKNKGENLSDCRLVIDEVASMIKGMIDDEMDALSDHDRA